MHSTNYAAPITDNISANESVFIINVCHSALKYFSLCFMVEMSLLKHMPTLIEQINLNALVLVALHMLECYIMYLSVLKA